MPLLIAKGIDLANIQRMLVSQDVEQHRYLVMGSGVEEEGQYTYDHQRQPIAAPVLVRRIGRCSTLLHPPDLIDHYDQAKKSHYEDVLVAHQQRRPQEDAESRSTRPGAWLRETCQVSGQQWDNGEQMYLEPAFEDNR